MARQEAVLRLLQQLHVKLSMMTDRQLDNLMKKLNEDEAYAHLRRGNTLINISADD